MNAILGTAANLLVLPAVFVTDAVCSKSKSRNAAAAAVTAQEVRVLGQPSKAESDFQASIDQEYACKGRMAVPLGAALVAAGFYLGDKNKFLMYGLVACGLSAIYLGLTKDVYGESNYVKAGHWGM
jgi:hypothetical protein